MITEYFMYICISTYKIQFGHYSLLSGISPRPPARAEGPARLLSTGQHHSLAPPACTFLPQPPHSFFPTLLSFTN